MIDIYGLGTKIFLLVRFKILGNRNTIPQKDKSKSNVDDYSTKSSWLWQARILYKGSNFMYSIQSTL